MRIILTAVVLAMIPFASVAQTFPAPLLMNDVVDGDALFASRVQKSIPASRPIMLLVDASYSAVAPNNGKRRNTQGKLVITISGRECAWDNYGNEIGTSTAAGHAHCMMYLAAGQANIDVRASLRHGRAGGEIDWRGFGSRKARVPVMAFRAQDVRAADNAP